MAVPLCLERLTELLPLEMKIARQCLADQPPRTDITTPSSAAVAVRTRQRVLETLCRSVRGGLWGAQASALLSALLVRAPPSHTDILALAAALPLSIAGAPSGLAVRACSMLAERQLRDGGTGAAFAWLPGGSSALQWQTLFDLCSRLPLPGQLRVVDYLLTAGPSDAAFGRRLASKASGSMQKRKRAHPAMALLFPALFRLIPEVSGQQLADLVRVLGAMLDSIPVSSSIDFRAEPADAAMRPLVGGLAATFYTSGSVVQAVLEASQSEEERACSRAFGVSVSSLVLAWCLLIEPDTQP